jgi:hemoglobin
MAFTPQHDERFAAYLTEAFGGPKLYTAGYGSESSVQQMHACNGDHVELDEACIRNFEQALTDVGIESKPAAEAADYFRRATESQRRWSQPGTSVPEELPFNYA